MARAGHHLSDVIESAGAKTKKAQNIKSHHNVGGLPETLHLKLLEPLRELFKDEVRELGLALGLPREMVFRHPFPGPGLGVRILGAIEKSQVALLQRADAIFIEELRTSGWYDQVSQAFAVFLPVRSVGVMGDGRTYENVVALRAVQTSDFMTADWAPLPHDLLARVSNRIINEGPGINRVAYDISSKPPRRSSGNEKALFSCRAGVSLGPGLGAEPVADPAPARPGQQGFRVGSDAGAGHSPHAADGGCHQG